MADSPSRILFISYPLLTVSDESAGGAEQVLWNLERELSLRGSRTTVAASQGSRVAGELFATGAPCRQSDDFERRNREHQEAIIEFVGRRRRERRSFDLIHDMSGSFWSQAAELDTPLLATLHLPRSFYPAHLFAEIPENVRFNCVSAAQAQSFANIDQVIGVAPNGVALDRFEPNYGPRAGLLWIGRICEEKGPHIALEIAGVAGEAITLAGQVYPFSYHQNYFQKKVVPQLRRLPEARFIESPSMQQKRSLLRESRALVITSSVDETSSLVAMEAAASGTPVVAFRRGALPEVIKEGVTGFLVDTLDEAVRALRDIDRISPSGCVRHARANFSSARMAQSYAALYAELLHPHGGFRPASSAVVQQAL
jgi:glycosyltransferase involved in cell wall biosynthesis